MSTLMSSSGTFVAFDRSCVESVDNKFSCSYSISRVHAPPAPVLNQSGVTADSQRIVAYKHLCWEVEEGENVRPHYLPPSPPLESNDEQDIAMSDAAGNDQCPTWSNSPNPNSSLGIGFDVDHGISSRREPTLLYPVISPVVMDCDTPVVLSYFDSKGSDIKLPPSPTSPPRNAPSTTSSRNNWVEIPWIEAKEENLIELWSSSSSISFSASCGDDSTSMNLDDKGASTLLLSPPLCPLASPPPSPRRRALSLPTAPPIPLAQHAPPSADDVILTSSSNRHSPGSSTRSETSRRERGRRSEVGSSSSERRHSDRSPPRRSTFRQQDHRFPSSKIGKSMPPTTCEYRRPSPSSSNHPTRPALGFQDLADREGYSRVDQASSLQSSTDEEESDEYDERFVDLGLIRDSRPLKAIDASLTGNKTNTPAPHRRSSHRLKKFHSEKWHLFAVAGAKQQRTGEGYWSYFGLDLS